MKWLYDRLLLIGSALALLTLTIAGMFVLTALGLKEPWGKLWPWTVILFLILIVAAVSEIRRRRKKLLRTWPLIGTLLIFLVAHLVVLGWMLGGVVRDWRMPQFYVLGVVEVMLAGIVFEQAYALSIAPRRWTEPNT
jgi:hypothetical protein